jgi:hypothetical protein
VQRHAGKDVGIPERQVTRANDICGGHAQGNIENHSIIG